MNHSIYSADRTTHLKIVVVALVGGIAIAGLGLMSRVPNSDAASPDCRRCQSWQADDDKPFGCFGYSLIGKNVIWTLENDRVRSGEWDTVLWSIGIVLGAAIVYLAYLS